MKSRVLTPILPLALILFATCASAEPLVYVITASQEFGTVDLADGHFTLIGTTTDVLSNLVWRDGTLMTLTTGGTNPPGSLVRIDPATGEEGKPTQITVNGQPLGFFGFELAEVRGRIYVTDFNNSLYLVNPSTGVATAVGVNGGATGMPPDPHFPPLTFDPNDPNTFFLCDETLYGIGGKIYASFDSFAIDPYTDPSIRSHEYVSPALWRIDPLTGAATFVAKTDWNLTASVEADGKVYAFTGVIEGFDFTFDVPVGNAEVVTLDLATGRTGKVVDIDDPTTGPIFGAAPVRSR